MTLTVHEFSPPVSLTAAFSHYLSAKASDLFAGIAPIIGGMAEPVAKTFNLSESMNPEARVILFMNRWQRHF